MKKTEENLLFHFPFLIEKYAVGVPLRFTVKESIVFELRVPLGASMLRVANFNFELTLLGLGSGWGPKPGSKQGSRLVHCTK